MIPGRAFEVRDGIQYDMHLHGSRFIVVEFVLATGLMALLLLFSARYAWQTPSWPWWLGPWIVICAGMMLNCAIIAQIARRIARAKGARPERPDHPALAHYNWVLPLLILVPFILPILAWRQRPGSDLR